jgi:hypothetical protein
MKKIEAILKGCKMVDKLFGLREKEIRRKIEAAMDECESIKVESAIAYVNALNKLGEKDVNYEDVINTMMEAKGEILSAETTLKIIKEIEKDLNSECDEPQTKD